MAFRAPGRTILRRRRRGRRPQVGPAGLAGFRVLRFSFHPLLLAGFRSRLSPGYLPVQAVRRYSVVRVPPVLSQMQRSPQNSHVLRVISVHHVNAWSRVSVFPVRVVMLGVAGQAWRLHEVDFIQVRPV